MFLEAIVRVRPIFRIGASTGSDLSLPRAILPIATNVSWSAFHPLSIVAGLGSVPISAQGLVQIVWLRMELESLCVQPSCKQGAGMNQD